MSFPEDHTMYNADLPTRAELPSTKELLRSTLIALATAIAILVTAVLPAEYAVDPTGIGRVLGLTQMGEIKMQLAAEAAQDRASSAAEAPPTEPADAPVVVADARTDEISVTLAPGEGAEVKLTMQQGARTRYEWTVSGGVVNYDLHGDGRGNATSYQQGRGAPGRSGELEAAFDGSHGWFWRNRGTSEVTVTLRVVGAHTDIRRVV
jgi:hypothetical protein